MSDSDVPDLVGSSDDEGRRPAAPLKQPQPTHPDHHKTPPLFTNKIDSSDESSGDEDNHDDNGETKKKRKKKKKPKKKKVSVAIDETSTTALPSSITKKQEKIISAQEILTNQMNIRWKNVLETISELQFKGQNGLKDMKFSWAAQKFAYDVIVENSEEERRHQELTADVLEQTGGIEIEDEHEDWYIDAPELLSLNTETLKNPQDTSMKSNKTHLNDLDDLDNDINFTEFDLNTCTAVDLSQSVKKWLEKADEKYRNIFKRRIYQLATGQRSYALSKKLKHINMPIYETKLDVGQRILWSQILRINIENDSKTVTLMIWYVAKHDTVPILLKQIEHSYGRTIKQIEKYFNNSNNIHDNIQLNTITLKYISAISEIQRLPMLAIPDEAVLLDPQANIPLKIYPVLDLNTLSYPNWRAPLRLNKLEQSVRSQSGTVLLLGRSGTGKTLCLMDRMHHDRLELLRQQYYSGSSSGGSGSSGCTTSDGIHHRPSQLFVARSLQLCELVKRYQQNNIMDTTTTSTTSTVAGTTTGGNTNTSSSNSSSEIDNYFMRMRQFLIEIEKRMLATTTITTTATTTTTAPTPTTTPTTTTTLLFHHTHKDINCIDYNRFNREIFPDIIKDYKQKNLLDSLIVWTQIRSFLKGSIDAILAGGILPKTTYYDFEIFGKDRCRLQLEQRKQAYELFERYEQYRLEKGLWDEMDRVQYILTTALRYTHSSSTSSSSSINNIPQRLHCTIWPIHYNKIYVDEIQDYTQAEIGLFLYAVGFHTNALFLAGDPAQSVVEGVDFRFEEVRSLIYKLTSGRESIERPIKLLSNYRSHNGVLTCAAAIIDKLLLMFPGSANVLMKDEGLFTGPRPNYCHVSDPTEILRLLGKGVAVLTYDHSAWLQRPQSIEMG